MKYNYMNKLHILSRHLTSPPTPLKTFISKLVIKFLKSPAPWESMYVGPYFCDYWALGEEGAMCPALQTAPALVFPS